MKIFERRNWQRVRGADAHREGKHYVVYAFHKKPVEHGIWLTFAWANRNKAAMKNPLSLSTPVGTMFTAGNISVGSLSFEPTQTAQKTK